MTMRLGRSARSPSCSGSKQVRHFSFHSLKVVCAAGARRGKCTLAYKPPFMCSRNAWIVSSLRLKKIHSQPALTSPAPALQRCEMRRHRRLRQGGALVDQAGADAKVERIFLFGEILAGRLEPGQYPAPYRIGQRLVDCIDVHRDLPEIFSSFHEINIGTYEFMNRYFTIYICGLQAVLLRCQRSTAAGAPLRVDKGPTNACRRRPLISQVEAAEREPKALLLPIFKLARINAYSIEALGKRLFLRPR